MSEQELITTDNEVTIETDPTFSSFLTTYGDRPAIREMSERLMIFHPDIQAIAKGLSPGVAKQIAREASQLCLVVGASPIPGLNELHIWFNEKERTIHLMLGKNYWERRALYFGGAMNYDGPPRAMSDLERQEYGVNVGDIAFIWPGYRADQFWKLLSHRITNRSEIYSLIGKAGIGTVNPKEYDKKGRPSGWTAAKRATADLYRQLFPVEPGDMPAGEGMKQVEGGYTPDFKNGHWNYLGGREQGEDERALSVEEINSQLFG